MVKLTLLIVAVVSVMDAFGQGGLQRTNWYYFAATAIDNTGQESDYSNEVSLSRYWGHYWRSVTLAWDPSPSTNVVGYLVYWGTNHSAYSNHSQVLTGTTGTVQVFPPPLTNHVVKVTTSRATNLLAADRLSGPWVLLNRTNWGGTNSRPPQYWRAIGRKGTTPRTYITNYWQ